MKKKYTKDIVFTVANDKVVTEKADTTTTKAIPTTGPSGKCDATQFCCCGKKTGKMCIKNNIGGAYLIGNCEKDPDALYECETSDYQAKFLKICGGVKGCESIKPGTFGADFCEDF